MTKKVYKLTEAQITRLHELINSDGAIIDGDTLEGNTQIKTNMYRDSGRPETTDDFADATGQDPKAYYNYRGFAITEQENKTTIPQLSELSKSYKENAIQASTQDLIRQLSRVDSSISKDVEAIVLKAVLTSIDLKALDEQHKEELKKIINQ